MTDVPDTHGEIAVELMTKLMKRLIATGALTPDLVEQTIDAAEEELSGAPNEGKRARIMDKIRRETENWKDRYGTQTP